MGNDNDIWKQTEDWLEKVNQGKSVRRQFVDELSELTDHYLLKGMDIDQLKDALGVETRFDHKRRRDELLAKQKAK